MAQRKLELCPQKRQRGPQLVSGVGDEPALTLEPGLEPGEHRVQRLPEALDLVTGVGHGQALARRRGRDRRRPPAHRVDLAQRQAREQIAGQGCQHERDRPGDQELVPQPPQGLGPVLAGRSDHQHEPPAAAHNGRRQQPRRLIQAGQRGQR